MYKKAGYIRTKFMDYIKIINNQQGSTDGKQKYKVVKKCLFIVHKDA